MSKRPVQFFESIAPVRLYLEDIEAIVARLQELSPEADITLATSGHEFVTVEELSGLGRHEVSELEIRCLVAPKPFHAFLVSIGPKSVSLYRAGDTPADRRVFQQLEALLLARRRPWQWRDRLLTLAGVIGPLPALALMLAKSFLLSWLFYAGAILTGVSLSMSAIYLTTERWRTSRVILVRRQDHRGHWGDVAAALITVALVTAMAVVTMVLAHLAGILFTPAS